MADIISEDLRLEYFRCAYETINSWVDHHTYPITSKIQGRFDIYGSGVGVLIGGAKYVATAKHLMDELLKAGGDPYVHTKGGAICLSGRNMIFDQNSMMDYDICLISMGDEFKDVPTVPFWNFYIGDKIYPSTIQYLQGFPVKPNTARKVNDRASPRIGYYSNIVKFDQEIRHGMERVSDKTHWIFMHNGGLYQKDGGELQKSNANNMPSLKGLSGCGMWSISNVNNTSTIKLAGIFTMHHLGVGVGTKIKYVKILAEIANGKSATSEKC